AYRFDPASCETERPHPVATPVPTVHWTHSAPSTWVAWNSTVPVGSGTEAISSPRGVPPSTSTDGTPVLSSAGAVTTRVSSPARRTIAPTETARMATTAAA